MGIRIRFEKQVKNHHLFVCVIYISPSAIWNLYWTYSYRSAMVKKGRWRMELMAGNMSMLKVFQKKILKVLQVFEKYFKVLQAFLKILNWKIWYSKRTHILILIVIYHSYNVQTCEGEYEYGEGTFLFPVPLFSFITYKL